MPIDIEELKARITQVRNEGAAGVRPQPARAVPQARARRMANPSGLLRRAYNIPIIGYVVRIATAVFNLPRILANLQNFYTTHSNDLGRFYAGFDELRLHVDQVDMLARDASTRAEKLQKLIDGLRLENQQLTARLSAHGVFVESEDRLAVRWGLTNEERNTPIEVYVSELEESGGVFVQIGGLVNRTRGLNRHAKDARLVSWPAKKFSEKTSTAAVLDQTLSAIKSPIGVLLVSEDLCTMPADERIGVLDILSAHMLPNGRLVVEHISGQASAVDNDHALEHDGALVQKLAGFLLDAGFRVERAIRFATNDAPLAKVGAAGPPPPISIIARKIVPWPRVRPDGGAR